VAGIFVLEADLLVPSSTSPQTSSVCVFMHPCAAMNMLPMPIGLARCGLHVLICSSRYAGNDSGLMMENCCKDLGSVIAHCRGELGYKDVVLCGWSGGGSLSAFYQSQAGTPAADRVRSPIDLTHATLPPADALIVAAAHSSRARILTECLDPSIWLFSRGANPNPSGRQHDDGDDGPAAPDLGEFDLYGPRAPTPP